MNDLTPDETEAILTLCLMAAFADGEKHEREREQIRRIAESFRGSEVDLSALYQEVLLRKPEPTAHTHVILVSRRDYRIMCDTKARNGTSLSRSSAGAERAISASPELGTHWKQLLGAVPAISGRIDHRSSR